MTIAVYKGHLDLASGQLVEHQLWHRTYLQVHRNTDPWYFPQGSQTVLKNYLKISLTTKDIRNPCYSLKLDKFQELVSSVRLL